MLFQNRTRFPFLGNFTILGVAAVASLGLLLFAPSRVPAQEGPRIPAKGSRLEVAFPLPRPQAPQVNRPDVLDLEPAVTQAELILAVRLVDVTETRIVHGGRDVQVTEQYRFEPVRVLKGIFAHESLLLTGQDLGIYRFAGGSERLPRGQLMLVLLGRQGQNYFNCNIACPTLSQSIPRLESKDDPLLPAVEALIGMTRLRDRVARVELLRDALKKASGRAVSPLLLALSRRASGRAALRASPRRSCRVLKSTTASTREVAARTLGAMLEADRTGQGPGRSDVARAIASCARDRRARRRRAGRPDRRAWRPGRTCRARPGRTRLAQVRPRAHYAGRNRRPPAGPRPSPAAGSESRGRPRLRDNAPRFAA